MRNGTTRCTLCNCHFDSTDLLQHQNGRRHLRNVESAGPFSFSSTNCFQQKQRRHRSTASRRSRRSKMTSNIQSAPPADIPPLVGVNISTCGTDPRVNVSGEGGLYFFVEGSGTSGNSSFSFSNRSILIEKTNMRSKVSLQSVVLTPPLGSCFTAIPTSNHTAVQKNQAHEVIVSFQPSRVGSFHAVLEIRFRDKGQADNDEFTVTRELHGRAIRPGGFAMNEDVEGTEDGGVDR